MTDLEIIKENAHRLYDLESYEPYEVDRDAIIEAAERMAARIEELEKPITFLSDLQMELHSTKDFLSRANSKINELEKESAKFKDLCAERNGQIQRMKYALKKRPEIVRCEECEKKDECYPLTNVTVPCKAEYFCKEGVRKAKGEE